MQPLHTYRTAFGIKGKSKASSVELHLIYAVLFRELRDVWQGKTGLGFSAECNGGVEWQYSKRNHQYSSRVMNILYMFVCNSSYSNEWDTIARKLIFRILSLRFSLHHSNFLLALLSASAVGSTQFSMQWLLDLKWLEHDACQWNPPSLLISNTRISKFHAQYAYVPAGTLLV